MLKPGAENLITFIYTFGAFGTAISIFFLPRPEFADVYSSIFEVTGKKVISKILAFMRVWLYPIIVIVSTLVFIIAINLWGKVEPPPPTPTPAPTPHETIAPPSATPSIPPWPNKTKLVELTPLKMDEGAFFFGEWNQYESIIVNHVGYPQSIGVQIPKDAQDDYYERYNTLRKTHKAEIEYSLGYQYKTLMFFYGIDDRSFPDDLSCAPQCHFWIVVQSCSAEDDHFEKEDTLFKTEHLNYYHTLSSSGNIDVTGAEAVRITVFWEFDVIQSKPLALNIAIIDPTLYS